MVYGPIAKPHSIINWQRSSRQVQQRAGHPRNMQAGSVTPLMSEDLWPLARRSGGQRNVVSSVHGVGEKTLITRSGSVGQRSCRLPFRYLSRPDIHRWPGALRAQGQGGRLGIRRSRIHCCRSRRVPQRAAENLLPCCCEASMSRARPLRRR